MRTRLEVPFEEKEQAKSLGARWSSAMKTWYCPDGVDLRLFKRWLPKALGPWLGELPRDNTEAKRARRKLKRWKTRAKRKAKRAEERGARPHELTEEQRDHLRSI